MFPLPNNSSKGGGGWADRQALPWTCLTSVPISPPLPFIGIIKWNNPASQNKDHFIFVEQLFLFTCLTFIIQTLVRFCVEIWIERWLTLFWWQNWMARRTWMIVWEREEKYLKNRKWKIIVFCPQKPERHVFLLFPHPARLDAPLTPLNIKFNFVVYPN